MAVQKRTIGRVPVNRGNYEEGQKYYEMNIVQMFGSSFISRVNDNITPPAREENGTIIVNRDKWDVFADSTHAESAAKKADKAAEDTNATNTKINEAEGVRKLNEQNRINGEDKREDNETKRNTSESLRNTNEGKRKLDEVGRSEAEDKRVVAESARVTEFGKLKQESQAATNSANQAATKANTAATTIDAKINPIVENDKLQDEKLRTLEEENTTQEEQIQGLVSQTSTAEKVTSAALLEQVKDIEGLKSALIEIIEGRHYFDTILTRSIKIDGASTTIISDTTPSVSPEFIGQFYIDKMAKIAYIAVGNNSIEDWKPINVA